MTVGERAGWRGQSRAERVRSRRVRQERIVEEAPREPRSKRRKARQPRHRHDVMLPGELGAEMRLPALPTVRPGVRLLSAALLAATAWALQGVLRAPSFEVVEASVQGARLLSEGQVRSIAQVDGLSVFLLDPRQAVERLLAYPEVAEAELSVRWPNRVEITIRERYPMVEWTEDGRTWWVSADGVAFLKHGDWPGLVQLESVEPVLVIADDPLLPVVEPGILQSAAVLSSQMPEIGAWRVSPVHGFSFEDPRGWTGYFGFGGDMVTKARIYEAMGEYVVSKGIQPALISVEDMAAPFYSAQRVNR